MPISSSKLSWGGPRLNSGGPRPNSGGPRPNSGGPRPGAGRKPHAPANQSLDSAATDPALARSSNAEGWYCVRTAWHGEMTADLAIRAAGFTVFMPTIWLPATSPRRDARGTVRPGKPDRIVPMFGRYLFVRFRRGAEDWHKIRGQPGVDGIFAVSPGNPSAVPEHAITRIRDLCAANDCLYPPNVVFRDQLPPVVRAMPLATGVTARLLNGPMADLTGLCAWSDGQRVKLLMQIMGSAVPVFVDQADVEVV